MNAARRARQKARKREHKTQPAAVPQAPGRRDVTVTAGTATASGTAPRNEG